ncbi:hypothetical protein SMACR_00052 [Sordaria macrospora]|uniref:Integrase catalytic domain-containing protein n=1 Tax=Sordaria macrospora TaxID=5147 RepID=A0A8S8ZFQ4_SORMA|nr:hypothetical protein SMACR_00052 [Sordaria macrospora]WPJ58069.1 hypothetical protein SMAC4_00052 [Sordaria macrospora]
MMHAGKEQVMKACQEAGITLSNNHNHFCDGCMRAKATDTMLKHAHTVTTITPVQFIRGDVIQHNHPNHLGQRYCVHFICEASGHHWVDFCTIKGEAFTKLKQFKKWIELQTGLKVKVVGLDGGPEWRLPTKEFQNSQLYKWANEEGVQIYKTTAHTPWMNGKSERAGAIIMERSRALMIDLNIPPHLWSFVVQSVVIVMSLMPSKANPEGKSPHELLCRAIPGYPENEIKPWTRHLRSYFCTAYYYIKPQNRTKGEKLEERSRPGRLIGYADAHGRIYWIWDPETGQIIRASAVKFVEKDQSESSEKEALQHAVVFSDQTVQEIRDVTDSSIQYWITVAGIKPHAVDSPAPSNVVEKFIHSFIHSFIHPQLVRNKSLTSSTPLQRKTWYSSSHRLTTSLHGRTRSKNSFFFFFYLTPEATRSREPGPSSPEPQPTVPLPPDQPMRSIEQEEDGSIDLDDLNEENPSPNNTFEDTCEDAAEEPPDLPFEKARFEPKSPKSTQ